MNKDDIETLARSCGGREEFWTAFIGAAGIRTFCEVGVFAGFFARRMLESCPSLERYYLLDPWRNLEDWNKPSNTNDEGFERMYLDVLERTEAFRDKRVVLRGKTSEVSSGIAAASLDAVYIDGDHTLRGVAIDLAHMHPKVRRGGWVCGDDFTRNIWEHGPDYDPTFVFPYAVYYAEAHDLPIYALPWNQFAILNDPQAGFAFIDLAGGYTGKGLAEICVAPNRIVSAAKAALSRVAAKRSARR